MKNLAVDPVGPKERGVMVYPRDPLLTSILSAICPGAGQVYNGQAGKGLFFLFTCWIGGITWVWSVIDAYRVAEKINKRLLPNTGTSMHLLLFLLIPLLIVLALSLGSVAFMTQLVQ